MSAKDQKEEENPKSSKSWGERVLLWMYQDQSSKNSPESEDIARSIASSLSEFSDPSQSWLTNLLTWGILIVAFSGLIELLDLLWQPLA